MKTLIVATSHKPPNFYEELEAGQRYRLDYLELSQRMGADYLDYDFPNMHKTEWIRGLEEKFHIDFYWARQIAKKVKKENYELVISMSERAAVPLAHWLDRRVHHIVLLHNILSDRWFPLIKTLKSYRRWDKIVTFSQAEADALKRGLDLRPNQVQPVHFYVDTDFFQPEKDSEPEEERFIMSQGLGKRDYPTLIRALQTLPHVTCRISAVSAWDDFQAGYEGMEIPENIHLKSYNHPKLIRDMNGKSYFVVIPLQTDIGTWSAGSSTVLQVQAMGKPIIVTALPGISEYVKDGETGFLVEGNNPEQLAEKIDYLWQNPDKTKEMGERAQAWVSENFSLDHWLSKFSALVDEIEQN